MLCLFRGLRVAAASPASELPNPLLCPASVCEPDSVFSVSFPEGRERSRRPSLSGRGLHFVAVGHFAPFGARFLVFRDFWPCASVRDRLTISVCPDFWHTYYFLPFEGHWGLGNPLCGRTPLSVLNSPFSGFRTACFGPRTFVLHRFLLIFGRYLCFITRKAMKGWEASDFGNENVELVRSIAKLKVAKAVILGNHDAWRTQQFAERRKDRVQLQLECLGEEHVGYQRLDYPVLKLSIVGGRPFSCGGEQLFRTRLRGVSIVAAAVAVVTSVNTPIFFFDLCYHGVDCNSSNWNYPLRYGVHDMEGSAKRIYEAALGTPKGHLIMFLAHNGPTGLGSNVNDICGRDWVFGGGDHGDPDLAHAISQLKETTKLSIPLVVFGHMHKELAYGNGLRKMIVVGADNTIYLNGAIVPRVKRLVADEQATNSRTLMNNETSVSTPNAIGTVRAFTLVEISDGKLKKIAEAWVSVIGDKTALEEEHILYSRGRGTEISV
ncbi:hypothetical protein HYC85_003498 [Camellia sinensis]|uniref:Calcineurin-like phosphoesterase domain-containing protein n=1 Tax=Camellia sinensis TaxID=4442 RepID=A0A7J7HTV7_CAMSI|nr:hypothetical protein HYC85_003498 [Camellia sinensis]